MGDVFKRWLKAQIINTSETGSPDDYGENSYIDKTAVLVLLAVLLKPCANDRFCFAYFNSKGKAAQIYSSTNTLQLRPRSLALYNAASAWAKT